MEKEIGEIRTKLFGEKIEKAVAEIGETCQWADGTYKKVGRGEWVKVTQGKEKAVSSSTVLKKIKLKIPELQEKLKRAYADFEKKFAESSKYPPNTAAYREFFNSAWFSELKKNEFVKKIRAEQKDLEEEINEIKAHAREKNGEFNETDLKDKVLNNLSAAWRKVNEVPRFISAKQAMPQVTLKDYYLDTETTFKSICPADEKWRETEERWEKMKKDPKLEWHHSPKSSSQYLIDESTGDIYRYSDHWGSVASCSWHLDSQKEDGWDIAKSNIRNFERLDIRNNYFNPQYRIKAVETAKEIILPSLQETIKIAGLTKTARKTLNAFCDKVFWDLHTWANMSLEEVKELRKKYELV